MERYRDIIPDYGDFLDSLEEPLPTTARVNTIKSTPGQAIESLRDEGFGVERLDWYDKGFHLDIPDGKKIGNTFAHYHGWIHVQEEVSMLPPVALDPKPGDTVLDICAAPGSKTTQLAMEVHANDSDGTDQSGSVLANDDNIGRIAALRNNMDRLGTTNVAVTSYDGRRFPGRDVFDSAVVDVPCSSEGTARKYPEHREGADLDDIDAVQGVQKGILSRTIDLVKPGGTVIYSTCTFAPEENEEVLDYVIGSGESDGNGEEEPRAELRDFEMGLEHESGVTEWNGDEFDEEVEKAKRFYPHQNDTGGFFVAKLEVLE